MLIDDVRSKVDTWAEEVIGNNKAQKVRDNKVFRDPIHDFIRLYPHEVAVLDCPLMQRLRGIHQTALAYLVYPGMHHTRFEHSLGVVHVADLMFSSLQQVLFDGEDSEKRELIRLAALLHDIGHVFLSHLGESLLKEEFGEMFLDLKQETIDGVPHLFRDNVGVGEILSYLIITCKPFQKYFNEAIALNYSNPISPIEVARLVIGKVSDQRDQYQTDIIHGGMDADKLDYFMRDCHYSGIRAEVDASRLINTLAVVSKADWPRSLTVSGTALHHLEQILITKLILFTSIYHHHKIRTSEAIVKIVYRKLKSMRGSLRNKTLEFNDLSDFLRLNDSKFFHLVAQEERLEPTINAVLNRDLLKRVLVLSRQTVNKKDREKFLSFTEPSDTPSSNIKKIEQEIYDSMLEQGKVERDYLVLDFPTLPDADKEAAQLFIQTSSDAEPEALKDLLPTDDWLRSYAANKYRAHVFYVADRQKRLLAANAAESVFQSRGLQLNSLSRSLAHID